VISGEATDTNFLGLEVYVENINAHAIEVPM
jgi:hypothetical protein